MGLIRREGITKAAVDKIPISSTAYGLFAHETAKESPASETRQVEEVERPKLELTPVQAVPHHRFVVGAKAEPVASETLTAYFCLCADSVYFLPFPVGHLTKKTRFGVVCSRINSLALPRGTALSPSVAT